ncbi:GNAT family N-acetyltransferase [Asanoa sp. NPDC050611]|uniref:GNAT family N-acetyltransferase n=1 Tax=Asanoa sp. NPDC050611 TaxID=3157098 RepID=UPI0033CF51F8
MTDRVDVAVAAWMRAMVLCAESLPGGFHRTAAHGTAELVTGLPVPTLNGVIQVGPALDPEEIAGFADSPRLTGLPWSLQVRGAAEADKIAAIAAAHKLDQRTTLPFMLKDLTGRDEVNGSVRRVSGADRDLCRRALAAGFEAPEEIFEGFTVPALLDHPATRSYVVEVAGEVVATSFGVLVDDLVGVFNIAVPPEHRRRGYGRLATAAVLRDAYPAGAHTAFLHASPMGVPLYAAMGFHTAETWNILS